MRADTSRQLHALILVLREELDDTRKRSVRRQLELARKRHWLFEHRLAIALATLEADDEDLARQVLIDDGIPLESVAETAAELRQVRAAQREEKTD
jgi:gluconate kinase